MSSAAAGVTPSAEPGHGSARTWRHSMSEQVTGLDRIAEPFREPVGNYARLVGEIAGDEAKSLTLFGAIAAGTFDPRRQVIRSVLVLGAVDLSVLRRIAEHGAKLGKHRIAAPLIMTPGYIEASLDTFPLELIEIQQMHVTLFGPDLFWDLSFKDADVRLQCERELKVILIGLRQGLLAAAGREKVISELETTVADGLLRTLRGLLWLKGRRAAKPAGGVLDEIEKLADRKLPGVRVAVDATAPHGWSEFERLYHDVEALGEMDDGW